MEINFDLENLIKVRLRKNVNVVIETLTRMGIGNFKKKQLIQTCYLLKIKNDFYILHYKEFFGLTGKNIEWNEGDLERRNQISELLESYGLLNILNKDTYRKSYGIEISECPIKIYKIKYEDKKNYELIGKINIVNINNQFREDISVVGG